MTRDKLKSEVAKIIDMNVYESEYHVLQQVDIAAEEIMKLWDQGFTYDLPTADCCKHGVCTCSA